jgi:hypothetical protein
MAEFDSQKGAFLLVAMIIATMMLLMVMGMGTCVFLAVGGNPMPVCSDLEGFAKELITMAFTAAIAFAGGRMSAPAPPPLKLPPPKKVAASVVKGSSVSSSSRPQAGASPDA